MKIEDKYTRTIMVRIDPDLHEHLKNEADRLDIDLSSYIRWCIRTGVYLKELNRFVRSKTKDLKLN
jgi:predicted HicB family RNase H-like nuclease